MEAQSKRLWIVTVSNITATILFLVVFYAATYASTFVRVMIANWPTFILLLISLALSVAGLRLTKRPASSTSRRVALVVNGGALVLDSLIILGLGTMFAASPMERLLSFMRSPADRAIQEDLIRESVFWYRLEHVQGNGPFFLSIDGKDPSDTFMARFATSSKAVKKASGSYFEKDGWLRDRSTGEKGMEFSVKQISWLSSDSVEIHGGTYCGGLCADGGIYRLRKKGGRWEVKGYEEQWVS